VPSGIASEQTVDPVTAPKDTTKSKAALRDTLDASELKDTDEPEAPAFVLQATRDPKSIKVEDLRAGQVRLPPLLLTADIAGVPLHEVLAELSRAIGVKTFVADAVSGKAIYVKFEKLPVEEGIKQILKGENYTLVRKKQPTGFTIEEGDRVRTVRESGEELAVAEIHVFSRNSTAEATTLKEVQVDDSKQAAQVAALAKQALEAETAKARLAALRKFVKQADRSQLTSTLISALKDEDASVRGLALESIADGEDPPLKPIADAALLDESPTNRRTAIDALLSIHGAVAIPTLEQALNDPDPAVQEAASSALETALAVEKLDRENK
jgi:HEAT repeat protein